MRNNKTLLVAGILLLATTAVAQAQMQGIYEVIGIGATAREGGAAEMAGDVVMFLRTGDSGGGVVTVRYSAPLAKGTAPMLKRGTGIASASGVSVDLDDDKYTVTLNLETHGGGGDVYTLSAARLDLREGAAPVMATVSGDSFAIVSGNVTVISSIEEAVAIDAGEEATSVLTRGTGVDSEDNPTAVKSVKITEGFSKAFTGDVGLKLVIEGLPEKAMLAISAVGKAATGETDLLAGIQGDVTLGDTMIVTDNIATGDVENVVGDGKDIELAIEFAGDNNAELDSPSNTKKETLTLKLVLVANSGVKDLALPLMLGDVRVSVTMTPNKAPDPAGGPYFTENFVPADGAMVFKFDPASCTLLFPYAITISELGWNTGIAISNPSAFGSNPLNGALTFTLFANGDEMPMMYTTEAGTPGPNALNDEGMLEAGNTYTVLLSELAGDG